MNLRSAIHGARMPNWVDPPLPLAIALIMQSMVDAGLQADRHRLRGAGDIQRHQQIVDQLDLGRGAKGSEIKAEIGKIR